jgi:hypothetical protein
MGRLAHLLPAQQLAHAFPNPTSTQYTQRQPPLFLVCTVLRTPAPCSALRCTHPTPALSCAAVGRTWRRSSHRLPPSQRPSSSSSPACRLLLLIVATAALRQISSYRSQILSRRRQISSSLSSPPLSSSFFVAATVALCRISRRGDTLSSRCALTLKRRFSDALKTMVSPSMLVGSLWWLVGC